MAFCKAPERLSALNNLIRCSLSFSKFLLSACLSVYFDLISFARRIHFLDSSRNSVRREGSTIGNIPARKMEESFNDS